MGERLDIAVWGWVEAWLDDQGLRGLWGFKAGHLCLEALAVEEKWV